MVSVSSARTRFQHSDKSVKLDQRDALPLLVLSAHQQLQNEGFLSAWTNSFVGPWEPSQGLHNPDEKIKLWLFLPGQHSSVAEKAQLSVSRLRVLASGLWVVPGESEEVAAALSQALRNCIERALRGLSYVRFGDVFSKHHSFIKNEELFRRLLLSSSLPRWKKQFLFMLLYLLSMFELFQVVTYSHSSPVLVGTPMKEYQEMDWGRMNGHARERDGLYYLEVPSQSSILKHPIPRSFVSEPILSNKDKV